MVLVVESVPFAIFVIFVEDHFNQLRSIHFADEFLVFVELLDLISFPFVEEMNLNSESIVLCILFNFVNRILFPSKDVLLYRFRTR